MVVDESRYQHQREGGVQEIDHERAVAEGGVTLAIPRAIQGIHEADPFYPACFAGWKRAGAKVGAYGVLYPSQHPRQQGKTFWQFLRAIGFDVRVDGPIAGDVELRQAVAVALMPAIVRAYFEELEDQAQTTIENYTGAWCWDPWVGRVDPTVAQWAPRYPLWVADHVSMLRPQLPIGYSEWDLWQFSSTRSIPGILGYVDLSRPRVYFPDGGEGVYSAQISAAWLRIRGGPGIEYPILGGLARGEIVEVYDELGAWLRMSPDPAPPAWIHGGYTVRVE